MAVRYTLRFVPVFQDWRISLLGKNTLNFCLTNAYKQRNSKSCRLSFLHVVDYLDMLFQRQHFSSPGSQSGSHFQKGCNGLAAVYIDILRCYMVVGNFKGTASVPKTMSCLAAHLQWDIRFVSWLNPIESLWRASSECNIRFVPRAADSLRLPQECPWRTC